MSQPSPQLRALLDDLRAAEQVTPTQVDHAWTRFSTRRTTRRRWVIGVWLGGFVAVGAALLAVPSLRAIVAQADASNASRSEAVLQAEPQRSHEASTREAGERAARKRSARGDGSVSPVPAEPQHEVEALALPAEAVPTELVPSVEPTPASNPASAQPKSTTGRTSSTRRTSKPRPAPPLEDVEAEHAARSLAAELQLLDDADRALREGDLVRVEQLIQRHRTQFVGGSMIEERKTLARRLAEAQAVAASSSP